MFIINIYEPVNTKWQHINSLLLLTNTQCFKLTQTTLHEYRRGSSELWPLSAGAEGLAICEKCSFQFGRSVSVWIQLGSGNACVDAFNIAFVSFYFYFYCFNETFDTYSCCFYCFNEFVLMKPLPHNIVIYAVL